ncbi:3-hydroxyacyl-CoA dehydrogenase family protein [Noviherbaspirillum sp. Root189]|uniref:3-hydroxyacyl-CoA dehydrogenase family protein n=1 Tax=Noviherbaspirillum sp. Root189 TaxID=1736487 RepID=UPI0007094FBB|nr:3-hydroxyacyl-CoA dehydrogenase NAD-binding domain-containing protein [Noviherbaspirillum sp. Root189]KRB67996.1 hypothetical protein ASE07_10110 [Noviherbaspirillum sp. Root189]
MSEKVRVAVIGAGLMGHGIAQAFAQAGHPVMLTDANIDVLNSAPGCIERNLVEMGLPVASALRNISVQADFAAAVERADLIVEAVSERLDLKQTLFANFVAMAPAHAILASNTSVIPISEIASNLSRADRGRVLGTHWWNPPHLIPLVEVIRTVDTYDEMFDSTYLIIKSIGKLPVKVNVDLPGVEAGVCDARTIDTVVKNSFGRRLSVLGPMENADLVGLELIRDVHKILFPHLSRAQSPSVLLEHLLSKGETGVGTGKGLFKWSEDSIEEVRSKLANHLIACTQAVSHHGENNE